MSQTTIPPELSPWHDAWDQVQKETEDEPEWLRDVRRRAFDRFLELGLPRRDDERWKQSRLDLRDTQYAAAPSTGTDKITDQDLLPYEFEKEGARLVFVDGHYCPDLSQVRDLPEGASIGRTFEHLDDPRLREHLEKAATSDHPFAALNVALATDGAWLRIPRGRPLDAPVHFLFLQTDASEPRMSQLHNVVMVEGHGEASIVETYAGIGRATTLTNATTWIAAGLRAHVDHVCVQREGLHATHMAQHFIEQHRDSTVRSVTFNLGAARSRHDIEASLQEEGAHCDLHGLYLGAGDQHADFWTRVDHAAPHCSSDERFKGILTDRAHSAFLGNVLVRPGAVKTSSNQENRNLLLSEKAHADSTPQLEILNDDVQCAHGSTVGQLDAKQLFYLQSRGIPADKARIMLTEAFAAEILEEIPDAPIRKALEALLSRWFEKHAASAEAT